MLRQPTPRGVAMLIGILLRKYVSAEYIVRILFVPIGVAAAGGVVHRNKCCSTSNYIALLCYYILLAVIVGATLDF